MACSKTAFIEFKDCESSYLFEVELTPNTSYFYEITDKFGNVYQKAFTTDGDGYFSISPNDFPPYLFTNAGGNFTLIVKESLTDCGAVDFDYCEDTFDTIVFSFIKNTENGNVPIIDKCQKVYDCLGISENGSESKFLNEQGVFETPSGQVQADWNQTDNTEVDFIKNKPSIPSISGLATESYVDTEVSGAISSANGYTDSVASSKVDKVTGYGLSKNDLTDSLKSTYDGYASQISAKANKATQRSGTVIAFDTEANYGTIVSPLTGNITGDYTGAIIGVVQLLIHNDSVAPTIPATWIKANTSASYTAGVVNFIAITWLSSNIATYTIWKSV